MKIVIAGSRSITDYDVIKKTLKNGIGTITEVVSGAANGADRLGERWAEENNVPLKKFPADWNKYKKAAGPIRNKQMAEYADAAVIFWDGKSRGSVNMAEQMKKLGKPYYIVKVIDEA